MSKSYHSSDNMSTEEPNPYFHGILTEWNDERGYGFITPQDGGKRIFLHIKNLRSDLTRPTQGGEFFYQIAYDPQGRIMAVNAFASSSYLEQDTPFIHKFSCFLSKIWWLPVILLVLFYLFLLSTAVYPILVMLLAFTINSLLTILFYWSDKFLAKHQKWRIPEHTLHFMEFFYGWPGALYAQRAFCHKTKKISFIVPFVFMIILNVTATILFFIYGKDIIEAIKILT